MKNAKNSNKKEKNTAFNPIKNLTKPELLAMAGWTAPGQIPKTLAELAEIRTALSKNAVLKSRNPVCPHKIEKKGHLFIDWLTLNIVNKIPLKSASWYIDANAILLDKPRVGPFSYPLIPAITEGGAFKIGDFKFKVAGSTPAFQKMAKVFYKGQFWGIFQYDPRKEFLSADHSTLKINNAILYQKGWAKSLVKFCRQTGVNIKHVTRIDLAFDVEDSSLFYFMAMQAEGLTQYDHKVKKYDTPRVLSGAGGELLQVVAGTPNRRLSIYNKTKEISEQRNEDGTEKKSYIRTAHVRNGMKGQVFRHELSYTHNYLRTINFSGGKIKRTKAGKSDTNLNIIKGLANPRSLWSLYADTLNRLLYFVPKGKKALQKNRIDIVPSSVGYSKLVRVKKPKPKFLGSYLNLLRNAFKAAVTSAEPVLVRGAVRLLHSQNWLETKYHTLKERWYQEEAQKANLLNIDFRPFEDIDFQFSNIYGKPTPYFMTT